MYRYSYDGAGNLVQVKNDSQTQVLKSYTYTPAGLLATATFRDKDGNTRTLSNTWDADSNRVGMNANGTQYSFVCDTTAGIPAVIEESSGGSTAHYIREPGGSLIARLNATEGIRYYHFDELGSTRLLTDADGDITDKYAYDAYGSLLSHDCYTGSINQPYQYVGQLGYYTHYQEPEFGLLQLGVRFYDPEVGRFASRNGVPDDSGRYTYAGGNPTVGIDPWGLAYMRFNGKKLCLYHDTGQVWMCCDAISGIPGKIPPIAKGKYRIDPDMVKCVDEGGCMAHMKWKCTRDLWGNWRCKLEPVRIDPGEEECPHKECFIHGGCEERPGTAGCIRIPDCRYAKCFWQPPTVPNGDDCLQRLMCTLRKIGTPIGLVVE